MVSNVIAKHVTLPEAETIVDKLERFAQTSAPYYAADPAEIGDALNAIADLRAWLSDLASRNQHVRLSA